MLAAYYAERWQRNTPNGGRVLRRRLAMQYAEWWPRITPKALANCSPGFER